MIIYIMTTFFQIMIKSLNECHFFKASIKNLLNCLIIHLRSCCLNFFLQKLFNSFDVQSKMISERVHNKSILMFQFLLNSKIDWSTFQGWFEDEKMKSHFKFKALRIPSRNPRIIFYVFQSRWKKKSITRLKN
jgi:hypothetical protein